MGASVLVTTSNIWWLLASAIPQIVTALNHRTKDYYSWYTFGLQHNSYSSHMTAVSRGHPCIFGFQYLVFSVRFQWSAYIDVDHVSFEIWHLCRSAKLKGHILSYHISVSGDPPLKLCSPRACFHYKHKPKVTTRLVLIWATLGPHHHLFTAWHWDRELNHVFSIILVLFASMSTRSNSDSNSLLAFFTARFLAEFRANSIASASPSQE
jgi:hypothetical protein